MGHRDDGRPFLNRMRVRNYRSIAACDVELAPFTVLVGPNGSGKSNFLDALRFVADSLRNSLDWAIQNRGTFNEIRRRSSLKGRPADVVVGLDLTLPDGSHVHYSFEIRAKKPKAYQVTRESCHIWRTDQHSRFEVKRGELCNATTDLQAAIEPDRLYLQAVSGVPKFRPVYDALSRMGFYNINPQEIRKLQKPDPSEVLKREGQNLASILKRLDEASPDAKKRIEEYLGQIVPGIRMVAHKGVDTWETVDFKQAVSDEQSVWTFPASSMSDGTLRSLGILLAVFQSSPGQGKPIPLVAIEEPEAAVHPAAARALGDAISEASLTTQVLVTSHSPDLLEHESVSEENILAVVMDQGKTKVGRLDESQRRLLKDGLYSPPELLRLNEMIPDRNSISEPAQLSLFEEDE